MHNLIARFLPQIYQSGSTVLSGVMLLGLFQFPLIPANSANPLLKKDMSASTEMEATSTVSHIANIFFGKELLSAADTKLIEEKVEFVGSRKAYPASLAVIKKHEKTIRRMAHKNGVPEDVAFGVGLLENGGSETAKSPAGALGVFQLMPGTARSLGLKVDKKTDERRNPEKNIEAGMRYLKSNHERFGDWGLATWAYHAGEGNVSNAIKLYAKEKHGVKLGGVKDATSTRDYVEKHGLTVDKLLSSRAVKAFTKKLNDDSAGYPYKVIATATLFKNAKHKSPVPPSKIVENI